MVSQSQQKPFGWRIERFNKLTGIREFDQTEYVEPMADLLQNMGRTWRVVVTELYAGPHPDVTQDSLRYSFLRLAAFDEDIMRIIDAVDDNFEADTPEKFDAVIDAAMLVCEQESDGTDADTKLLAMGGDAS